MVSNATKNRIMWIALAVCAAGVVSIVYFTDMATQSTVPAPTQQSLPQTGAQPGSQTFTPSPQPPGEVPPGKVWSTEHGHWHNISSTTQPTSGQPGSTSPGSQTFTPSPQPPGEVPPGKVWSTEHGHWHDAHGVTQPTSVKPGATPPVTPTYTPGPQPPGEPPPGKVWSTEHGHWHNDPSQAMTPQAPTIRKIEVQPKDSQ